VRRESREGRRRRSEEKKGRKRMGVMREEMGTTKNGEVWRGNKIGDERKRD
jgi:hypothetical protein